VLGSANHRIEPPAVTLTVEAGSVETGAPLRLSLAGRLDSRAIDAVWAPAMAAGGGAGDAMIEVNAAAVTTYDGAGVALLIELLRAAERRGGGLRLVGAEPDLERLFDRYRSLPVPAAHPPRHPPGLIEELGRSARSTIAATLEQVAFVGETVLALGGLLRAPHLLRWAVVVHVAETIGVMALPLIMLMGAVMGLIMAFQSAVQLTYYGADLLVANVVALSMVRELGPLMTAILLTGRSGSAFAAELGAMKVNEEIAALSTMGIDPVRFLVLPRLLAALAMTPLLALFMMVAGLVGGGIVMAWLGVPPTIYIRQVISVVHMSDFLGGLFKALVFGGLVAAVGCRSGLDAGSDAAAVGTATTSAVVAGILLIVLADGAFAVLFFALGI